MPHAFNWCISISMHSSERSHLQILKLRWWVHYSTTRSLGYSTKLRLFTLVRRSKMLTSHTNCASSKQLTSYCHCCSTQWSVLDRITRQNNKIQQTQTNVKAAQATYPQQLISEKNNVKSYTSKHKFHWQYCKLSVSTNVINLVLKHISQRYITYAVIYLSYQLFHWYFHWQTVKYERLCRIGHKYGSARATGCVWHMSSRSLITSEFFDK